MQRGQFVTFIVSMGLSPQHGTHWLPKGEPTQVMDQPDLMAHVDWHDVDEVRCPSNPAGSNGRQRRLLVHMVAEGVRVEELRWPR